MRDSTFCFVESDYFLGKAIESLGITVKSAASRAYSLLHDWSIRYKHSCLGGRKDASGAVGVNPFAAMGLALDVATKADRGGFREA
jgi:hypothetical protein